MFSNIRRDINSQWSRPNGGLQQLIIINVAVFLVVNVGLFFVPSTEEAIMNYLKYFALPTDASEFIFRPWTFITSFFTHTGFWHILWNMLFLFWFGRLIVEYLGSDRLINLYVLGGIFGSISVLLLFIFMPASAGGFALGASAGVFAVTVGAATLVPNYRFNLLFLGPVKIQYIAAFFIIRAFFGLQGSNYGGELAHLAGGLIGYLYIRNLQKGTDLGGWVSSTLSFFKSFFVRQPKMKVNYSSRSQTKTRSRSKSQTATPKNQGPSQDEIDAILDKISQKGYESLTKDEKEKLFNASKK